MRMLSAMDWGWSEMLWVALISICLVFFTVLLPMSSGAAIFCILLFVMQGIQQLSAPAYENWQVELAEAEHCTSYYTARETLFMLIYTVANAAVQITISVSERMGNLQAGFFLAGQAALPAAAGAGIRTGQHSFGKPLAPTGRRRFLPRTAGRTLLQFYL